MTTRSAALGGIFLLIGFVASSTLWAEARRGIQRCEVTTPRGEYALVVLEFDIPEAPQGYQQWKYLGGMRDGVLWMEEGIGLRQASGKLELRQGTLRGEFVRNNSRSTSSTSLATVPPARVMVEAAVEEGELRGTARIEAAVGKVTGRLITAAELRARNAVSSQASWPAFLGPLGAGHAALAGGHATIDDPARLRLVWRCEERDIGQGIGSITRFMDKWKDASARRTGSGSSSPIAADGRLYLSYYVPAPRPAEVEETKNPTYLGTESTLTAKLLEEARAAGWEGEQLPEYAREKVFQAADDCLLCLDAATGQTLWKAVIRGRGFNMQHHKAGPFNMSPVIAEGKVFALGMSGWLYAFHAVTGEPLWEARSAVDYSAALTVAGGVVLAPVEKGWGGFDAETGELLWTNEGRGVAGFNRWAHEDREYFLGRTGPAHAPRGIECLEPRSGESLWRLPVLVLTSGRGLGPGGITLHGDRLLVNQDNGSGVKNEAIEPVLACYQLSREQAELLWQVGPAGGEGEGELGPVHRECVPIVVHDRFVFTADLRTLELATGRVVDQSQGPIPRNGGYLQVMEDLVLVRVDGTHGGIRCGFYKVSPEGKIRSLTETEWAPPFGGGTTSYHHPIHYPVLDGRLFLRQQDGLYCWDLRAAAGE